MSERREFEAEMQDAGGGGVFVRVPFDVQEVFGKKRVKVRAEIDGEPYRGSLVRMGEPCHMLLVLKEIRAKLGKGPGDMVRVSVTEDLEPRVVELPDDVRAALGRAPDAEAFFDGLAYSHKRQYLLWIEDAKQEKTRANRIAKMIEMLRIGRKER